MRDPTCLVGKHEAQQAPHAQSRLHDACTSAPLEWTRRGIISEVSAAADYAAQLMP